MLAELKVLLENLVVQDILGQEVLIFMEELDQLDKLDILD